MVWFDFSSMPQEPRTPEEEDEFKGMLSNINVIFLGTQVLILLDMTYTSRFWTQAEAWMSMQDRSQRSAAVHRSAERGEAWRHQLRAAKSTHQAAVARA